MATVIEKHTRRNRVQFTMTRLLFEAHQRNLELAKKLGAIIDFNRDFERWFSAQVEQVAKELERLEEERTGSERNSVTDKPNIPSSKAVENNPQETLPKMAQEVTVSHNDEVADGNYHA